jgi:hypothetical protein
MEAVVWTDVLQTLALAEGMLAAMGITTCVSVGDVASLLLSAAEGDLSGLTRATLGAAGRKGHP